MPTIKTKMIEHFKVGDYSYAEVDAEITADFETSKDGLIQNDKALRAYFKAAREKLKEALESGEFDLT